MFSEGNLPIGFMFQVRDQFHLIYIFGWGVYIQVVKESCPPNRYHNHPWWGLAISLVDYREQIRGMPWCSLRPRYFGVYPNWIAATTFHRVELEQGKPIKELVFHGPVVNTPTRAYLYGGGFATIKGVNFDDELRRLFEFPEDMERHTIVIPTGDGYGFGIIAARKEKSSGGKETPQGGEGTSPSS